MNVVVTERDGTPYYVLHTPAGARTLERLRGLGLSDDAIEVVAHLTR